MKVKFLSFVTALLLSICFVSPSYAQDDEKVLKDHIEKAIEFWRNRDFDKAAKEIEALTKDDKNVKVLHKIVNQAYYSELYKFVLEEDPLIRQAASELIKKITRYKKEQMKTPKYINTLITELKDNPEKRQKNLVILQDIGQLVIPQASRLLVNETLDSEMLAFMYYVIRGIGAKATNPLIETLYSDDPNLTLYKNHVIKILGEIRDKKAVPDLKRIVEDKKELLVNREEALVSLHKILNINPAKLGPATSFYAERAKWYLTRGVSVRHEARSNEGYLFYWNQGHKEFSYKKVSDIAYTFEMAKKFAFRGLKFDKSDKELMNIYICAQFGEQAALKKAISDFEYQAKLPHLDDEQKLALKKIISRYKKDLANTKKTELLNHYFGPANLFKALNYSLLNSYSEISVALIQAVKEVADPLLLPGALTYVYDEEELKKNPEAQPRLVEIVENGSPLLKALYSRNPDVRLEAASAVAGLDIPKDHFGSKVIPAIMSEGISQFGKRLVVVTDENEAERQFLSSKLDKMGFSVAVSSVAVGGLERIATYHRKDIIIASYSVGKTVGMRIKEFHEKLRKEARFHETPLIIICDENIKKEDIINELQVDNGKRDPITKKIIFEKDKHLYIIKRPVVDIIIENAIFEAFDVDSIQDIGYIKLFEIAKKSSEALVKFNPSTNVYDLRKCSDAIIEAVKKNKDEQILKNLIITMGKWRIPQGYEILEKLIENEDISDVLKLEAVNSLGLINPQKTKDILKTIYSGNFSLALKTESAKSLGKSLPDSSEILKQLEAQQKTEIPKILPPTFDTEEEEGNDDKDSGGLDDDLDDDNDGDGDGGGGGNDDGGDDDDDEWGDDDDDDDDDDGDGGGGGGGGGDDDGGDDDLDF